MKCYQKMHYHYQQLAAKQSPRKSDTSGLISPVMGFWTGCLEHRNGMYTVMGRVALIRTVLNVNNASVLVDGELLVPYLKESLWFTLQISKRRQYC